MVFATVDSVSWFFGHPSLRLSRHVTPVESASRRVGFRGRIGRELEYAVCRAPDKGTWHPTGRGHDIAAVVAPSCRGVDREIPHRYHTDGRERIRTDPVSENHRDKSSDIRCTPYPAPTASTRLPSSFHHYQIFAPTSNRIFAPLLEVNTLTGQVSLQP